MGMYGKYTPIRVNFDLAPNLTPSDKKLCVHDRKRICGTSLFVYETLRH